MEIRNKIVYCYIDNVVPWGLFRSWSGLRSHGMLMDYTVWRFRLRCIEFQIMRTEKGRRCKRVDPLFPCLWSKLAAPGHWSAIEGTSRFDFLGIYFLQKEGIGRSLAFFLLCQCQRRKAAAVPKWFSFLFSSICSRCCFVRLALCNHVSLGYLCVLLAQEIRNPHSLTDTVV